MNSKQILKSARKLLEDRSRWVQYKLAIDIFGYGVIPRSRKAVAWCATGAISKVSDSEISTPAIHKAFDSLQTASITEGFKSVAHMNDKVQHIKLLEIFDYAIEIDKEEVPYA